MAETTKVRILDKDYLIACPEEERAALHQSAGYLDEKMREIRALGKIHGLERIAVMAALNIAHEVLQKDSLNSNSQNIALLLAAKVDEALQELS
jgi:cell division protein ZapA